MAVIIYLFNERKRPSLATRHTIHTIQVSFLLHKYLIHFHVDATLRDGVTELTR